MKLSNYYMALRESCLEEFVEVFLQNFFCLDSKRNRYALWLRTPHFKNDNNKFAYIESIKSFKDNAQNNTHSHTKYNLPILMQRQHQYDTSLTSIYQHLCITCQQFLSYGTPEMHKLTTKGKIAKLTADIIISNLESVGFDTMNK